MHGKGKLYRYAEGKWFPSYWKDDDLEEAIYEWDVGDSKTTSCLNSFISMLT